MMNHHPSQIPGNLQPPSSNHMNPNAAATMLNQTMNINSNNTMQAAHHHQQHGMFASGHHGPPMYDHTLQPSHMNGIQKGPSEFIYLNQQHPQHHHVNPQLPSQNQYIQSRNNNV